MDCTRQCREEFRVKNFLLGHENPRLFVTAQCLPNTFYIVWTTIWAFHHTVVMAFQPYFDYERHPDNFPDPKWTVYLTNWGISILSVYAIYDCIVTWYVHRCRNDLLTDKVTLPWYLKVQWVLFNIATCISIAITLMYFILLTPVFTAGSILTHIVTSSFVVLNLVISAKPVRVYHFIHVMIVSALYAICTVIYQTITDDLIYEVIDWTVMPNTIYLILGIVFVLGPTVHIICFTIYSIRVCISTRCCRTEKIENPDNAA